MNPFAKSYNKRQKYDDASLQDLDEEDEEIYNSDSKVSNNSFSNKNESSDGDDEYKEGSSYPNSI